jgi:hypothetical protein
LSFDRFSRPISHYKNRVNQRFCQGKRRSGQCEVKLKREKRKREVSRFSFLEAGDKIIGAGRLEKSAQDGACALQESFLLVAAA